MTFFFTTKRYCRNEVDNGVNKQKDSQQQQQRRQQQQQQTILPRKTITPPPPSIIIDKVQSFPLNLKNMFSFEIIQSFKYVWI